VTGDGSLMVLVLQDGPNGPTYLNGWKIDPASLKQYLRKDPIGWGYSLGLPWPEYRGQTGAMRIRCGYQPKQGPAVYCEAVVTLDAENAEAVPQEQPSSRQAMKPKG
jgi:hypothetical protein